MKYYIDFVANCLKTCMGFFTCTVGAGMVLFTTMMYASQNTA